ncbi:MAG TPA: FKBP-type peptidyl-prolyl cis-trans isomerase [Streptosporangiaceae bacterium]|nr:FKBP-type peptidyl-prolyl cis-trans isomerase [Streptosporangiaceae bacterium]
MRRLLAIPVIPLLACLVIAGCGSAKPASSASSSSSAATSNANANSSVTVGGAFGATPTVKIPKLDANNKLTVKTVIQGTGTTVTKADAMAADFVLYFWDGTTSALKANTFTQNPTVIGGTMLPGLETALIGQKVGSRVLAVIPPAEGYGTSGNSQLGIKGTTTLVFVIDLLKSYADTASASGAQESAGGGTLPTVTAHAGAGPTLTIPANNPPSTLVTKTLIKGSGPKVAKGQFIIAQYTGYIWRTKKVFDSSWTSGSPFGFVIGASPEQVIPGWDTGLAGQTVGSRVMLVIPPKDGYGTTGASQAGITGTDTLVFVVDIIDAFKPGT